MSGVRISDGSPIFAFGFCFIYQFKWDIALQRASVGVVELADAPDLGSSANMGMTSERARKWYHRWKLGSTPSVSTIFVEVIQLVECCLAKANAAGSTPRLLLQCLYSSVGRAHPWYGWGHAFKPHCKLHFIEGSHSGWVQWFAKSPNKFIVPRVQIPLPLPFIGVWCNGSITLSKSADWGSNPCTPASTNSFMAKSICKSIVE